MTIAEARKFYKKNTKKYEIEHNKEFLSYLKESLKKGYHLFLSIEDMQDLINSIAYWYELKYPEREMEYYEGIRYDEFENIENLSKKMDIKQLLYRLPKDQLYLLEGNYRSTGYGTRNIYNEEGKKTGVKTVVFMQVEKKEHAKFRVPKFLVVADHETGKIETDYNIKNMTKSTKDTTLEDLLELFDKKYADTLKYDSLKECVFDHEVDLNLRNKILQLVALKLLYSDNTIPERGYERAKRFINEFNKKLELKLSTSEIDGLIDPDEQKELTPDKSKSFFTSIIEKFDKK